MKLIKPVSQNPLVEFTRSHETYNDISYWLEDEFKKAGAPLDEVIVFLQYDNSPEVHNELFIVEEWLGFEKLSPIHDFLEDQQVIKVRMFLPVTDIEILLPF